MGFFKPNIEKMEAKKDVRGIIEVLKDKNEHVRNSAVEALAKIGEPAVGPLIEAMEDWVVRKYAAIALVKIGEPAVETLIQALKDEDRYVRRHAAIALENVGDKRAVEPLIQALRDEDEGVRGNAASALEEIGDTRAVKPLIKALKDRDTNVRALAARALGKIGDARAVEPLTKALKNKYRGIRESAAEALVKIGDARAVEPLIEALKDEDAWVRKFAAEALEKIGEPAVEPIIRMKLLKIYTILFRRPISPQEYAERARGALGYGAGARVVGAPPSDETFAKNAIREVCGDIWSMSSVPEVKVEKGDPADFSARHNPTLPGGGLNDYAIDFLKHKVAKGKDPDYFNIAGYNVYVNTSVDRITGDGALVIHIYQ
jgi:HEAT repeat protein